MHRKKRGKIGLRDAVWIVLSAPVIAVLCMVYYWVPIPSHKALNFCCPIAGISSYAILFYLSPLHFIFPMMLGLLVGGGIITVFAVRREE